VPKGGYRPGAGRPKGSKSWTTLKREAAASAPLLRNAPVERVTGVQYIQNLMNDPMA